MKFNSNTLRRWCRLVHRDLSYLFAGMVLIYALSGIVMNHRDTFNPNYSVSQQRLTLAAPLPDKDTFTRADAEALLERAGIAEGYVKHYFPDSRTLKIFLQGGSSLVADTQSGEALVERLKNVTLTVRIRAGENGKLFGALNTQAIADALAEQGIATGSTEGYIYVRAEYPMAVHRLTVAIEQAKELGLLGDNILGSGFNFHMHINCGAGAFVCGEGSAMTASIEGNRGMPRTKPPRSVDKGLYGKPTCLNNVETFANVPDIIKKGADWFKSVGTEGSSGTKAFALTGNVVNTGLIEVPMGTTMREVVYEIGGGIKNGKAFKAVQIGGPSGGCLTEAHMDLPMDFDSLKKAGAIIGSGGLVVMDEDTCMVSIAQFFMNFICNESCGKCTPCREGTTRMLDILTRITKGNGRPGDIEELRSLAKMIQNSSLCGLGKTAPNPVLSTLANFEDEYREHIFDKKCRTGSCRSLTTYVIDPAICKGCTKCARNCPAGAITGELKKPHHIDTDKCIKCGTCKTGCPFGAIKEA